ncbi:MAG: ABC transporter ATP-binding protein [Lactovum sp.]
MKAINVTNLEKNFQQQKVIDQLSFSIEENIICGFLGANGAGKTTTFKLLNALIPADKGKIEIFGKDISHPDSKGIIKFLHDKPESYAYMTAREYLQFICKLHQLDNIEERTTKTLEQVGLEPFSKKRISSFSRGMKQRIGIAANIISEPKILLLDEPVSALDPIGRKAVFDLIENLKGKMTILFSTHIISDVERVSDQIIMIHKGKKLLDGSFSELKKHFSKKSIKIEFINEKDLLTFSQTFDNSQLLINLEQLEITISNLELNLIDLQKKIFNCLLKEDIQINSLNHEQVTLEDIFMTEIFEKESEAKKK